MLFLIAFMAGWIPPDIIRKAGLDQIAKWSVILLVFSMGTTINMRELIAEWRTVVTALLAMGVIMLGAFLMMPFIGYENTAETLAFVATPRKSPIPKNKRQMKRYQYIEVNIIPAL